ncbi:MAG: MopE-related protein [Acidobacteriota bacterium]|nr:MopE-related protein [Acidobacteriota bacterium]MDH3783918.1 MopE-related protein [Acidobacteriota bacterium]
MWAATIYVDAQSTAAFPDGTLGFPYRTIQQGIIAASVGDLVSVAAGTYNETILMSDGVSVSGESATNTIIDGTGLQNSVVTFNGTRQNPRLTDFTIRGGSGDRIGELGNVGIFAGGGILISNSSPSIIDCIIEDNLLNVDIGFGGGIYILNESPETPLIRNSTIRNNVAKSIEAPLDGRGGGIYIVSKFSSVLILENLIEGNISYAGGGIFSQNNAAASATISRNEIRSNQANQGAAIFSRDFSTSTTTMANNLIVNNRGFPGVKDCDDAVGLSSPGLEEICNDGIDNDCNPNTFDIVDGDGDGFMCDLDCDDTDAAIYPGAPENCEDQIDNDCDGNVDNFDPGNFFPVTEGTVTKYRDNVTNPILLLTWVETAFDDSGWDDGTFGVGFDTDMDAANLISTSVTDTSASVYTRTRFQVETAAAVTAAHLAADYDDGYVVWLNGVEIFRSPEMPAGDPVWNADPAPHESSNGTEPDFGTFNDVSTAALPELVDGENVLAIGVYTELPGTSPDLVLVPEFRLVIGSEDADCLCADVDEDDYACADCNDADPLINPGRVEICGDTIDNDCDVASPDIVDGDLDGFTCVNDCDDTNLTTNPGAPEIPCDGLDNDCNSSTSDIQDADNDFFDCSEDCNDNSPAINPSVVEFCFDGLDNNCDGFIDSQDLECNCDSPVDLDADTYRCQDCNDQVASINPGANEVCNDGIDNDCSALTVDIFDQDGDGDLCDVDCEDTNPAVNLAAFEICNDGIDNNCNSDTDLADAQCSGCPDSDGDGYAGGTCAVDCNDGVTSINPGMEEVCNDGIDNDCDPGTPDLLDADGDGADCIADCDDNDPTNVPGTNENCTDLKDNDCDGLIDFNNPDFRIVQINSSMRYLANNSDPGIALAWVGEFFDDNPWSNGSYGVGYQVGPPGTGADDLISTFVPEGTSSVYARSKFNIPDIAAVNSVSIGADYDDGYVMWINGVEVYRSPGIPAGPPLWDTDPLPHESSNAQLPDYGVLIDVTGTALAAMHSGINVIAVGVYNAVPTGGGQFSTDLVVVPLVTLDFGDDDPDCLCEDLDGDGWAGGACAVDCNDLDPLINPGVQEIGCDGIDNDCDAGTDDLLDADMDGFNCAGDCADNDPTIFPGAVEVPCDFQDNDCSGLTPDVEDNDGDTFNCFFDCNDDDFNVNPNQTEIGCDGIDNDCSTLTADIRDDDRDGFLCSVDCDDDNPLINPTAPEKCDDTIDNDCDGDTDGSDDECFDCVDTDDTDGDGYVCLDCNDDVAAINPAAQEVCDDAIDNDCNPLTLDIDDLDGDGVDCLTDCDDFDAFVYPGFPEICDDSIDNDCDAMTADIFDFDMDGVNCDLDCDDGNAAIAPGLTELCGDAIDNDCDPVTLDVFDFDVDTFICTIDCDDDAAAVNPDAVEVCNDGIDNDCDPLTLDLADDDGDGFDCSVDCEEDNDAVNPSVAEKCDDGIDNDCDGDTDNADSDCSCADSDGDGYDGGACGIDCNDSVASINPGAPEICNDAIDNDCNPATVDFGDVDGDGFFCDVDCDDADPDVNTNQQEVCDDGKDNDCNPGTVDLFDVDMDGFTCDVDCNDGDMTINTGAVEIGCDGVDNDCDPMTPDIADSDGDSYFCADAALFGAGIAASTFESGTTFVINNTIIGNVLDVGVGGGVFLDDLLASDPGVFANNIVIENSALLGGGLDHSAFFGELNNNNIFNNVGGDFYNGSGSTASMSGNSSVDPQMQNPASGNYRLRQESPLVDAADQAVSPINDLDRFTRPYDGDGDMLAIADVGAFEYPSGEVFNLRFTDSQTLVWDLYPAGAHYNIYRSGINKLRNSGQYTQRPVLVYADQFCDVEDTALPFSATYVPAQGVPVFYLVTLTSPAFEGSLGQDWVGQLRPNFQPCP